ncbi:MAG: energy-coupling factor transporter transmembrane component T [Sphaerochaetaceae bacterium]|nr:energy-coupling factor transporter transmembrane component T [Sphaerochaetaceae bacterium]
MEKTFTEKIQIHKRNKIASLYPATKFKVVILFSISTIIINSIKLTDAKLALLLIPWFLLVPFMFAITGEFKKCMKSMKAIAFIAMFILLVQALIVSGGKTLFKWSFITIYEKGLQTGISLCFLILNIAGIFVWLFQSTSTKEITRWVEDTKMSFKVAYIFASTLEMIKVFSTRSGIILDAQRARGVETEGNLFIRAKAFIPTLVPLILGGIIGSEERVLTLEARGFSMKGKRTHLFNLEKSGYEKLILTISIIMTILILVGRIYLWFMK